MDFMKKTLNQVNSQENTLYDVIYNLFFFAKLKESEDSIKNGRVCTLEELRQHIDEFEAKYANSHIALSDTTSDDELYTLYLHSKLQKSQDDIKNGRVMTIEESKERMRKKYASFNVK